MNIRYQFMRRLCFNSRWYSLYQTKLPVNNSHKLQTDIKKQLYNAKQAGTVENPVLKESTEAFPLRILLGSLQCRERREINQETAFYCEEDTKDEVQDCYPSGKLEEKFQRAGEHRRNAPKSSCRYPQFGFHLNCPCSWCQSREPRRTQLLEE